MYGQSEDLVPVPPPLPAGPVWERLLFENPLPLVLVLIAGGVIAFYIFKRKGQSGRGLGAAGVLLALAAGDWLMARQVVTVREEVKAAAAALVDAAAKADTVRLDGLLDENAVAYTSETPNGMGRDRILAEVRRRLGEEYPVKRYAIEESQAVVDGPGVARAQLKVYVEVERMGSLASWWALDLKRDGSGKWRTAAIRPLHPWIAARAGR